VAVGTLRAPRHDRLGVGVAALQQADVDRRADALGGEHLALADEHAVRAGRAAGHQLAGHAHRLLGRPLGLAQPEELLGVLGAAGSQETSTPARCISCAKISGRERSALAFLTPLRLSISATAWAVAITRSPESPPGGAKSPGEQTRSTRALARARSISMSRMMSVARAGVPLLAGSSMTAAGSPTRKRMRW
jgi:hypothetical protein